MLSCHYQKPSSDSRHQRPTIIFLSCTAQFPQRIGDLSLWFLTMNSSFPMQWIFSALNWNYFLDLHQRSLNNQSQWVCLIFLSLCIFSELLKTFLFELLPWGCDHKSRAHSQIIPGANPTLPVKSAWMALI